jgi:hypothetical protein
VYAEPIGYIKALTVPAFSPLHLDMNIIRCKVRSARFVGLFGALDLYGFPVMFL